MIRAGAGAGETSTTARDPQLRVLLACDHLLRYTTGLANGLAERGCRVALLVRDHDHDFGGEPRAMQRYLDRDLDQRVDRVTIGGRVRDLAASRAALAARRRLAKPGFDVVHLQDSVVTDPRLSWVTGPSRRGYSLTVHDPSLHPGDRAPSPAQRWLRRRLIRNASLIFVHGEAMRHELVRLESPPSPIVAVPLGSETGEFTPLPDQPSLLFFGRISPYKGLDLLLDAMPRVWARLPDLRLTIAGRGELPRHQALGDGRIEVAQGHVPDADVAELFARATCVVLPYRQASQSAVGSLALQHGRAVVATAVGALPELVTQRVGRVVAPGDAVELANALVEVVGTPGLAERLGRDAAAESVGWDQVAERTIEAYAQHMPSRAARRQITGAPA